VANLDLNKNNLRNEMGINGNVSKGVTGTYIIELILAFIINTAAGSFLISLFIMPFLNVRGTTADQISFGVSAVIVILLAVLSQSLTGWYKKLNGMEDAPLDVKNRIQHILTPIIAKANIPMPTISIMNVDYPNACALGAQDIAVTIPILEMDDEALSGILAHEVGHLRNFDSVKSIRVCTMNMVLMVFQRILGILCWILKTLAKIKILGFLNFFAIFFSLVSLIFTLLQMIPEKIGLILSRQQEFHADAAAVEFGCGHDFIRGISMLDDAEKPGFITRVKYFFSSTHPPTYDRINRVEKLLTNQ